MRRCAENPINAEFTICGDAFDALETGDADEAHECAGPRQVVNCPSCFAIIQDLRDMKYKLRPRKQGFES